MKGGFLSNPKKLLYSTLYCDVFDVIDHSNGIKTIMLLKTPILKNPTELKVHLEKEIVFLNSNKHQNLINIVEPSLSIDENYFTLKEGKDILITTFISQKGCFSENESINIMSSLIQIYDLYKKNNMPIRDYSFNNLVINPNSNQIKIQDFGLIYNFTMLENQNIINFCQPPENFFEGKFIENVSEVWSLGMIFYYLLNGNFPWRGKTETGFFQALKEIPLKIPKEKQISAKTIDLLTKMLVVDYKKRFNWLELKNHEVFQEKIPSISVQNSSLKPLDSKWKLNIVSIYGTNDLILKSSYLLNNEKNSEKKCGNYPSLEENLKSIEKQSTYKMRISSNTKAKKEEELQKSEEKRLNEIDEIIQRIMDHEKMNFSLKKTPIQQQKLPSSYIKPNSNFPINLKESVVTGQSIMMTSQNTQPIEKIDFKQSMFLGKSQIKQSKIDTEKFFNENISQMTKQLEKYSVFGKTIADSELVFRKIIDLELWRIQRFLLLKKLIKFRLAFYQAFTQNNNLLDLPMWDEFIKSELFLNYMFKVKSENNALVEDLDKLFRKTDKSIQKYLLSERNQIQKFLNLDLTQNFDNLFFILLYLHSKTVSPKVEIAKNYNDFDKAIKLLMHKAEIIDCLIINELEFLIDIPEYFDLSEFQKIISSYDYEKLSIYVKKKEEILENWKIKYIY